MFRKVRQVKCYFVNSIIWQLQSLEKEGDRQEEFNRFKRLEAFGSAGTAELRSRTANKWSVAMFESLVIRSNEVAEAG